MNKKELKAKYDGKKIGGLEKEVDRTIKNIAAAQRKQLDILYYMRFTGRYRENPQYGKSSFDAYLRGRFAPLTEYKFDKLRRAYLHYPEQAEKFGPGVVLDAVNKCGIEGAGKAFREAGEVPEEPTTKFYQNLHQVIEKHKKEPASRPEPLPTRAELIEENARLRQANADLLAIISEQREQIDRLKETVAKSEVPEFS